MMRNYIKTAWRTMIRNRTYSITNLIGLSLGLLVIMLISSLVLDELSYDHQWTHRNELYRIRSVHHDADGNVRNRIARSPAGLSTALATDLPEIAEHTHINLLPSFRLTTDSILHRHADLTLLESDTNFFNLFDTQAIEGNPKQVIAPAKNLVITERAHRRYFDGGDVVGKIYYNQPEQGAPEPYVVRAILKDLPQNTYLEADAILVTPHQAFEPDKAGAMQEQYIRTRPGTDTAQLTAKVNQWFARQELDEHLATITFELQSIKDVHLHSETGWNSPIWDLYMLTGIGLLILALVCINFINLTFAHAVKRTQETGIRKVLGAGKVHLIIQLATDSLLLFGGALCIAFLAYRLVLPAFEQYLGHPLTVTFLRSWSLFSALLGAWLALGIVCSIAPASALAKTKAHHELKKQLSFLNLPLNMGFTRGLIVFQFGITMVVLICMLTIGAQLRYMDNKSLGYEPDNLLVLDATQWEGKSEAFKQTLLQHPSIASASLASWSPFSGSADIVRVENPANSEERQIVVQLRGDFDFAETMGIELIDGRMLQLNHGLDIATHDSVDSQGEPFSNILATETAVKQFGLRLNEQSASLSQVPVGIVKDFHAASLRFPVASMVITAQRDWSMGCLLVRVAPGRKKEALAVLTTLWNEFFPNRLSRINWADEQVKAQYEQERKQFQQLAFFSSISMVIALLGILGIAIYTIERRVKEIGVRKVLGASLPSIVSLLSTSFSKLILVATVLAFPVAWWLMHKWLENFTYRIDVPLTLFVLTGIVTWVCMFTIVGLKVLRAARSNPVNALRDE